MKVKDPVCEKPIETMEAAEKITYQEKDYYFCSPSCYVEFQKDPKSLYRRTITGAKAVWSRK